MPVIGFPLREVAYCIIMTDSEVVPIADKTISVPVDGVVVLSAAIPRPHCSQSPGALETVQRQQSQRICSFSKLPR